MNTFEVKTEIRVRYNEVDSQGIVFNANYLNYCDIAITEYFRFAGQSYTEFLKTNQIDFHVVKSVVEYFSPARFDDAIVISVSGSFYGPRVIWNIQMQRESSVICKAELTYAAIDTNTGKVKRLTSEIGTGLKLTESQKL